MRLSGVMVDLERYEKILDEMMQQQQAERRIIALERFKFWLGIPNEYYNNEE
jgi:hypothetical protein